MKIDKFKEMYTTDILKLVEKDYKDLSYLSWATAYKMAMLNDSNMTYEILEDSDGMPFFSRGNVHIVKTKVTMFGEAKTMILPVMDNKHNSVESPNSRQINDNIMRCLVKNIAMFGLGLPLYVGEDLEQFKINPEEEAKKNKAIKLITSITKEDDITLQGQLSLYDCKSLKDCTSEQLKKIYEALKGIKK